MRADLSTRLPGRHNALNALAALTLADALRLARDQTASAVAAAPCVPGRFEAVPGPQPFDVVVGYAHNSGGVRRALEAAREVLETRPGSRLRVICSVPSFRYREQRRVIGKAAALLADDLVLTTERRPDSEQPGLPAGLAEGARDARRHSWTVVLDRRDAIERTLRAARPGDLVAILDRGAQSGPLIDGDGRCRTFDDRQALDPVGWRRS